MKTSFPIIFLVSGFVFFIIGCSSSQTKGVADKKAETIDLESSSIISKEVEKTEPKLLTDPRDGEIYAIVTIGEQIWMAENLRYNAPGSKANPDYPSKEYGRVYDGTLAQSVCPDGWHLPSDLEWNKLEMALGMKIDEIAKTFWRGTHGTKMKSEIGWPKDENGTNSSGFNGLPAGFYFTAETESEESYFDGLGGSAGYWTAMDGNKAWVRFLGGPLEGVNRFADDKLNWMLGCRCVKN